MIPLRDNVGAPRLSPVNLLLIAVNVAVFGYEIAQGSGEGRLFVTYGLIPARLSAVGHSSPAAAVATMLTLITALFLHGNILHIAGNMLYLFIFGPAIEMRFGHGRYIGFYLLGGIVAGLVMVAMGPGVRIPTVGASGAIAAVLGAYFVLYPGARILTILPLFILVEFIEIPAVLYLLLWFGIQLWAGLYAGGMHAMAGDVAWWAHIGGFLFGVAVAPLAARSVKAAKSR